MIAIAQHGLDEVLLGLAMLFALCVAVVVVFHRLKLPAVAGFLVAGALMGPHALGLIDQEELVKQLAEVGVVVLLFTVGMELSIPDLWKMRRAIFIGGGLQVLLTVGLGAVVALLGGWSMGPSLFLGFLLALSSTAAVTKLLQDRGELGSPPGRLGLSVCVAQDLAIVPMILCLPLLAGDSEGVGWMQPFADVGEALTYLLLLLGGAWFVVPRVLDLVSRTRSREVFILAVFTLCLTAALTTSFLGLSLALGAFLVGVVLAASGYHHQAVSEVEPFRDTLSSLFFVSIGMLFDFREVLNAPWLVTGALAAVILGKALMVWIVSRVLRLPLWVGLRTALLLAQVGEFSFVLVQLGRSQAGGSFMQPQHEKIFLAVAVMSIAITPLLYALGRRLTRTGGMVAGIGQTRETSQRAKKDLSDHVIVVGFGPVGQAVTRALRNLNVPYRVIEMNAATVKAFRQSGVDIFMGDATREAALHTARVQSAKLIVLTVPDPNATRRTVDLVKRLAPQVQVVARTTYLGEVRALQRMGVHDIVPQELETSVEIMVRVLRHYLIPDDEMGRQVRAVRERSFGIFKMARPEKAESARIAEYVPGLALEVFRVQDGSNVVGKSLLDSDLRKASGCTVVAVKRGDETNTQVRPDTVLEAGDILVVLGPEDRMADVTSQCSSRDPVVVGDAGDDEPPEDLKEERPVEAEATEAEAKEAEAKEVEAKEVEAKEVEATGAEATAAEDVEKDVTSGQP
ncbi:MAG: cation:proton antiporter domain-containing protein [Planctomycetota bacterium]